MTTEEKQVLKKTDNVSIRIDSDLSSKLHEKCIEQKISLNTLINHLLEKQVNWNELTTEMGWVSMFRSTFRELSDWYLELSSVKKLASYERINIALNKFNSVFGNRIVNTILPVDLEDYQEKRIDDGLALVLGDVSNPGQRPPDILGLWWLKEKLDGFLLKVVPYQLLGGSQGDNLAVVNDSYPVAEALRFLHVVSG